VNSDGGLLCLRGNGSEDQKRNDDSVSHCGAFVVKAFGCAIRNCEGVKTLSRETLRRGAGVDELKQEDSQEVIEKTERVKIRIRARRQNSEKLESC
jgi:hypothetical protein